jgi:hypothetical protein
MHISQGGEQIAVEFSRIGEPANPPDRFSANLLSHNGDHSSKGIRQLYSAIVSSGMV